MDSETRTELDAYIEDWKRRTREEYEAEVADGKESDPEWVEAMRASDAGAWDEA